MIRPNILVILTDDQNGSALSCAGNRWLYTPAMDSLASQGTRFTNAYAVAPQCTPSRYGLLNGVYPSSVGVRGNSDTPDPVLSPPVVADGLANTLNVAGYHTAYSGKTGVNDFPTYGFAETLWGPGRERNLDYIIPWLQASRPDPWILVTSWIQPHDINLEALHDAFGVNRTTQLDEAMANPPGVTDTEFFRSFAPLLPPNFPRTDTEPDGVAVMLAQDSQRQWVRDNWTEQDWRRFRWAYFRLVERVDGYIGQMLSALYSSPYAQNTVVIFASDHGYLDCRHELENKQLPYHDALHSPLIVRPPGGGTARVSDAIVNTGLDLLPTVLDYAGVDYSGRHGQSARLAVEGMQMPGRVHISEYYYGYCAQDGRYKLWRDDNGSESLFDWEIDPGEMTNLGNDSAYDQVRAELGAVLDNHIATVPA